MMQKTRDEQFQLLVSKTMQNIRQRGTGISVSSLPTANVPIIELVNQLIEDAVALRASDLHLEPRGATIHIRVRVDGELCEMHEPLPIEVHAFLVSRIKIISGLKITEHRLPQDGHILYTYHGNQVDIRVSTMPVMEGEKVVLRLLNNSQHLLSLAELEFSPPTEKQFRSLCHRPNGMILLTGPVNSGKTTTLYAAMNDLNSVHKNLATIEDPVEYRISGINQTQVNPQINLTFAQGLRALLRQDIDILMIGECRDGETASIAVRAALTGHLVFSTLHTKNAVQAIVRMLDMGVEPYMLCAAVDGILAQRLVRRICPQCAEKYLVDPASKEAVFLGEQYVPGMKLMRGCGCDACGHTGYKGRIALQELLVLDDACRQAIKEQKDMRAMEHLAAATGMLSLLQDGIAKAAAGKTTLAEVGRVIYGEF